MEKGSPYTHFVSLPFRALYGVRSDRRRSPSRREVDLGRYYGGIAFRPGDTFRTELHVSDAYSTASEYRRRGLETRFLRRKLTNNKGYTTGWYGNHGIRSALYRRIAGGRSDGLRRRRTTDGDPTGDEPTHCDSTGDVRRQSRFASVPVERPELPSLVRRDGRCLIRATRVPTWRSSPR